MMRTVVALTLLLSTLVATANEAVPTAHDPVAAARSVALAHKLRCLVCQNQSIADSDADLAKDLRRQIDEQIAAGRSDEEIIAFMTGRYGDFVLYKPPLRAGTIALWVGPAILLLLAAWTLRSTLKRPKAALASRPGGATMSSADRARAQSMLDDERDRDE
jgi:cytochrome c-type biogenesis protein CcmH